MFTLWPPIGCYCCCLQVRVRLTTAITSRDADITKLIEECKKLQVGVSFCVVLCACVSVLMH